MPIGAGRSLRMTQLLDPTTSSDRALIVRLASMSIRSSRGRAALDGVDFNVYKGETTLLLGHNGAGKTTLMNIILGKLQPDSGFVAVNRGDHYFLGQSGLGVGYCPPLDVLDEYLSVREHLELLADIKLPAGVAEDYRSHHIKQTIADFELSRHSNYTAADLPTGIRRKLSIGLAFVGNSSVLILEEPSSGLDPDSHVPIWAAIRRHRENRTILMSTQHMGEAEYLGDRIAIMSKGKIICSGSSAYLKSLFGGGYKLRVECNLSRRESVLTLVRMFFVSAEAIERSKTAPSQDANAHASDPVLDMVIELSREGNRGDSELSLISLLEEMEKNSSSSRVRSFGLRSSSIEDVLLNICQERVPRSTLVVRLEDALHRMHLRRLTQAAKLARQGVATEASLLRALVVKHRQANTRDGSSDLMMGILIPLLIALCFTQFGDHWTLHAAIHLPVLYLVAKLTTESASKFKTVQLTSQADFTIYWLAQLVTDLRLAIQTTTLVNILIATKFSDRILLDVTSFHVLLASAMLLFIGASTLFAYIVSHLMAASAPSAVVTARLNEFGFAYQITQWLVYLATHSDVELISWPARQVFALIFPVVAFNNIILAFSDECYIHMDTKTNCTPHHGSSVLIFAYLALTAQVLVLASFLFILEANRKEVAHYFSWRNIHRYLFRSQGQRQPIDGSPIDPGVVEESNYTARAIEANRQNSYGLVAADLGKSGVEGTKVVEDLSFTVKRGECFGLLCADGSSKAAAISMLIGELKPDSGWAWANGHCSNSNVRQYRRQLGYLPRISPETSLSPYEAFVLIAELRLIGRSSIPVVVGSLLGLLDLQKDASKSMSKLSGGTKRKVALGMSLIGNPAVLVLDEPTAGLDPMARRRVWKLLQTLVHQYRPSIVVSSNAMNECEAQCDRISILASTRLRCIGSLLQLREKFSQGCRIRIQFLSDCKTASRSSQSHTAHGHPSTVESAPPGQPVRQSSSQVSPNGQITRELFGQLQSLAGNSVVIDSVDVNRTTIAIASCGVKRSSILKLLRGFRQRHPQISYYSYDDCSLGDIFATLAREDQLPCRTTVPRTSSAIRGTMV